VRHWYRRRAIAWLLWRSAFCFASSFSAAGSCTAENLELPASGHPVIVVGNLTVGGSGQDAARAWIAEFLKSNGWSPGIVSRGYGAKIDTPARHRSRPGRRS